MAQGKKYGDDIRERAFALLSCSNNVSEVAGKLGLPYSTVKTWEKKWLEEKSKDEKNESGEDKQEGGTVVHDLVKLRALKKEEFVNDAWGLIEKCNSLLSRRVTRALEREEEMDKLFIEAIDESTPAERRKAIVNLLATLKMEDTTKISTILGTLYDKQALACREATSIVGGAVEIKKFEDL